MASMIYVVRRIGKKGVGHKGKVSQPKKVKDMVIKHTPLYSHLTYGNTHDIKYTSNSFSAKPKFIQNFGNSSKKKDQKRYGYLRTKLSMLQMTLTATLKHQPWYLDSGCARHMT